MRVLCINEDWKRSEATKNKLAPHFMEECEVVEVINSSIGKWYQLEGYDTDTVFAADYFAILTEQSADEMSEEKREAIANIETPVV